MDGLKGCVVKVSFRQLASVVLSINI